MGFQVFFSKIVSIDFYGGGGPNVPSHKVSTNNTDFVFDAFRKGINPHFGIDVGIVLK